MSLYILRLGKAPRVQRRLILVQLVRNVYLKLRRESTLESLHIVARILAKTYRPLYQELDGKNYLPFKIKSLLETFKEISKGNKPSLCRFVNALIGQTTPPQLL